MENLTANYYTSNNLTISSGGLWGDSSTTITTTDYADNVYAGTGISYPLNLTPPKLDWEFSQDFLDSLQKALTTQSTFKKDEWDITSARSQRVRRINNFMNCGVETSFNPRRRNRRLVY